MPGNKQTFTGPLPGKTPVIDSFKRAVYNVWQQLFCQVTLSSNYVIMGREHVILSEAKNPHELALTQDLAGKKVSWA